MMRHLLRPLAPPHLPSGIHTTYLLLLIIGLPFLVSVCYGLPIQEGLIDPSLQPKFVTEVPNLLLMQPPSNKEQEEEGGRNNYYYLEIGVKEGLVYTGLIDTTTRNASILATTSTTPIPLATPIYGYEGSWPGPTIEATSYRPLQIKWKNELSPGQYLLTNLQGESLLLQGGSAAAGKDDDATSNNGTAATAAAAAVSFLPSTGAPGAAVPADPDATTIQLAPPLPVETDVVVKFQFLEHWVGYGRIATEDELDALTLQTKTFFSKVLQEVYGDDLIRLDLEIITAGFAKTADAPSVVAWKVTALFQNNVLDGNQQQKARTPEHLRNVLITSDEEEYLHNYVWSVDPLGSNYFVEAVMTEFELFYSDSTTPSAAAGDTAVNGHTDHNIPTPSPTVTPTRDQVVVQSTNNLPQHEKYNYLHHEGTTSTTTTTTNPASTPSIVTRLHGSHTTTAADSATTFSSSSSFFAGHHHTHRDHDDPVVDTYHNEQPATMLWFHDQTFGMTKYNVYCGLVGLYVLRDQYDTGKPDNPLHLPTVPYEAAFIIQDRIFKENGELFFPTTPPKNMRTTTATATANREEEEAESAPMSEYNDTDFVLYDDYYPVDLHHGTATETSPPTIQQHTYTPNPDYFMGDVMMVNGKIWPKFSVEPTMYRLRLLNACHSRFLTVQFRVVEDGEAATTTATKTNTRHGNTASSSSSSPPLKFTIIGGDQGMADHLHWQQSDTLLMEPSSRYDILLNFANLSGTRILMTNLAGDEQPFRGEVEGGKFIFEDTDKIMAFDVVAPKEAGKDNNGGNNPSSSATSEGLESLLNDLIVKNQGPSQLQGDVESASNDITNKKQKQQPQDGQSSSINNDREEESSSSVQRIRKLGIFDCTDSNGNTISLLGTAEPGTDSYGNPILWPNTTQVNSLNGHLTGAPLEGSLPWFAPITENPKLYDTEIWEIYNFAQKETHPIHIGSVRMQVISRHYIQMDSTETTAAAAMPPYGELLLHKDEDEQMITMPKQGGTHLQPEPLVFDDGSVGECFKVRNPIVGPRVAPYHLYGYSDQLPRDVVAALPHQVTRIKVTFNNPGAFTWQSQILSLEDKEMIRPLHVGHLPPSQQQYHHHHDYHMNNHYYSTNTNTNTNGDADVLYYDTGRGGGGGRPSPQEGARRPSKRSSGGGRRDGGGSHHNKKKGTTSRGSSSSSSLSSGNHESPQQSNNNRNHWNGRYAAGHKQEEEDTSIVDKFNHHRHGHHLHDRTIGGHHHDRRKNNDIGGGGRRRLLRGESSNTGS